MKTVPFFIVLIFSLFSFTMSAQYRPSGQVDTDLKLYTSSEIRAFLRNQDAKPDLKRFANRSQVYTIISYPFYSAAIASAGTAVFGLAIIRDAEFAGQVFLVYGGIAAGCYAVGRLLTYGSKSQLRQGLLVYYF
ncbi:hypothetical protein [Croceimicrobium hydrocarbonivorans]|uniref:Uncharacterized protein n=1 Tax=Croceimicrobium hydrocarbonivorans TaxID=2761580 RepID=A0A7H0VHX4_9FLAO|nr:hypothetical protein [Croceimicrobium hydrocarbonivorans]QNR25322.1 hypothetical protein H4K34_05640 [Croceimicrobium hydrocarbonivorans]